MQSILNINVSCFSNYRATEGREVNLLVWLQSKKYWTRVQTIRAIRDKVELDKLKAALPAITPSGLFRIRNEGGLICHSGFIQFDIDSISDPEAVKRILSGLSNIAYAGLSVSGRGLWGLISIVQPEHHKMYFQFIVRAFSGMGITIDTSGKDVCRLRGYSYDPAGYFNHQAKALEQLYKPMPKRTIKPNYRPNVSTGTSTIKTLIAEICRQRIDLTEGYKQWFSLGCSFANEFGEGGRWYFHQISQFHPDYNSSKADNQFRECLMHTYNGITIATFFGRCRDAGITLKNIVPVAPPAIALPPMPSEYISSPVVKQMDNEALHQIIGPTKELKPENWDQSIAELEQFFETVSLPIQPVKLNSFNTIMDVPKFIESHFATLKTNYGNQTFLPFLNRLQELKQYLSSNSK